MGMGKQINANSEADWGSIQILIFSAGSEMPVIKQTPLVSSPVADYASPAQVTSAAAQKQ
jgi:hypothetical protein